MYGRPVLIVVAFVLATIAVGAAQDAPRTKPALFEPRVVDVKVENVSLERVDVSMQIAVRASRNVTIRTLTFSDGFIDKIPVQVSPLEGRWPLRRGEEFVIPPRVQVTAYARDALGVASLAELLGRKDVDAGATVDMSFDTPWLARILGTAINAAVTDVRFKAPIPAGNPMIGQLTRLGAGVLEFMQRQAAPMLNAGPNGQAASRDVLDRFKGSVAAVEAEYEIEGGPAPGPRRVKTLGVWWTASTYCTTREAFEPWRYNAAEASQLQVEGARVHDEKTRLRIAAKPVPIELDTTELRRQLPKPSTRRVYSLATGEPRRMRLGLRTAPSALLCLQVPAAQAAAIATPGTPDATAPMAVFAVERPDALIWTQATPGAGAALTLRTPVHRQSLGSPLVTGDGVVGLVASPDTAWTAQAIATAAARPLRVRPLASRAVAGALAR